MTYKSTLFSVHPLDPYGSKVGGIETHVRQLLKYCPPDMRLVLRSEEHTSETPVTWYAISYAVFCLKKKERMI